MRGDSCAEQNFATKEALVKAIGTGVASGIRLADIDASDLVRGVVVYGALRLGFERLGWHCWVRTIVTENSVAAVVWLG